MHKSKLQTQMDYTLKTASTSIQRMLKNTNKALLNFNQVGLVPFNPLLCPDFYNLPRSPFCSSDVIYFFFP